MPKQDRKFIKNQPVLLLREGQSETLFDQYASIGRVCEWTRDGDAWKYLLRGHCGSYGDSATWTNIREGQIVAVDDATAGLFRFARSRGCSSVTMSQALQHLGVVKPEGDIPASATELAHLWLGAGNNYVRPWMLALLGAPNEKNFWQYREIHTYLRLSNNGKRAYLFPLSSDLSADGPANRNRLTPQVLTTFPQAVVTGDTAGKCVTYFASPAKAMKGQRETIKYGRWLKKYHAGVANDDIKDLVGSYGADFAPIGFELITDSEKIAEAYMDMRYGKDENAAKMAACMSYGPKSTHKDSPFHTVYKARDKHPCSVYGYMGDTALALVRKDGKIVGRSIINMKTKKHVRIYGNTSLTAAALTAEGFGTQGSLEGCRLGLVWDVPDHVAVLPYLDGDYYRVNIEGSGDERCFVVTRNGDFEAHSQYAAVTIKSPSKSCAVCSGSFYVTDQEVRLGEPWEEDNALRNIVGVRLVAPEETDTVKISSGLSTEFSDMCVCQSCAAKKNYPIRSVLTDQDVLVFHKKGRRGTAVDKYMAGGDRVVALKELPDIGDIPIEDVSKELLRVLGEQYGAGDPRSTPTSISYLLYKRLNLLTTVPTVSLDNGISVNSTRVFSSSVAARIAETGALPLSTLFSDEVRNVVDTDMPESGTRDIAPIRQHLERFSIDEHAEPGQRVVAASDGMPTLYEWATRILRNPDLSMTFYLSGDSPSRFLMPSELNAAHECEQEVAMRRYDFSSESTTVVSARDGRTALRGRIGWKDAVAAMPFILAGYDVNCNAMEAKYRAEHDGCIATANLPLPGNGREFGKAFDGMAGYGEDDQLKLSLALAMFCEIEELAVASDRFRGDFLGALMGRISGVGPLRISGGQDVPRSSTGDVGSDGHDSTADDAATEGRRTSVVAAA